MGDWKHDHMYLDNLMIDCFNASFIGSELTDDGDGGDTYGAKRYYSIPE